MPTVIVYWSPNRTKEEKPAVARDITQALVKHGRARREDVLIIFQDIKDGDSFRGREFSEDLPPHSSEYDDES